MNGTATTCSSKTGTKVFGTYFINSRGDEAMGTVWSQYCEELREPSLDRAHKRRHC